MNVYEIVNSRIVEMLENGVVPWRKSWASSDELPQNLVSKKQYRGINIWLLACAGYSSPWWLSFKQASNSAARSGKAKKAGSRSSGNRSK